MEWIELDHGDLSDYGSVGVHLIEVARVDDGGPLRAHVVRVAAGGVLGRHAGRLWQLFAVAPGEGRVSGGDGQRQLIRAGQAVLWEPGEAHESGSESGMVAVIVQTPEPARVRP